MSFVAALADDVLSEPRPSFQKRARNSYASLLVDAERGRIPRANLTKDCLKFLERLYSRGQRLDSSCVVERTELASAYPFRTGSRDLTFFHYTQSEKVAELVQRPVSDPRQTFDDLFTFLREVNASKGAQRANLYVAEDPESSKKWGPIQLQIELAPWARVYHEYTAGNLSACAADLESRHPGLARACQTDQPIRSFSFLMFAILEDNGVALYDYEGDQQFFQLVGPESITGLKINRF
jgi:hypothetical protein